MVDIDQHKRERLRSEAGIGLGNTVEVVYFEPKIRPITTGLIISFEESDGMIGVSDTLVEIQDGAGLHLFTVEEVITDDSLEMLIVYAGKKRGLIRRAR